MYLPNIIAGTCNVQGSHKYNMCIDKLTYT